LLHAAARRERNDRGKRNQNYAWFRAHACPREGF
jgi:hypothetical protein